MRLVYKLRGKVILKTSCEGTEEEQKFSSTLSVLSEVEGGGWSTSNSGILPMGKNPGTGCKEARWASGSVWTDAENLAPTGLRTPDRPDCNESRQRLRYPSHPPRLIL